jgi:RimJ/RimL family protein N-acetyltransferase
MRLEIDRHLIEPLARHQLGEFVTYRRLPEIARYQAWEATYSHAEAEELLREQAALDFPPAGQWVQFGIVDVDTGRLDGDVAVHAIADQPDSYELGVTLAPHAHGRGLATAALTSVVAHLFGEHRAHRVIATSDHRNESVRRMLTRVGFRHEGTLVEADWLKGEWTTVELWAMLRPPTLSVDSYGRR